MKKRKKQRERDASKAEKAASAPPKPQKANASSSALNEEDISPNQYFELRSRAIQKLRETRDPDPYPHKFYVTLSLTDFIEKYQDKTTNGEKLANEKPISLAGRIHNMRAAGRQLRFYDLWGEGVRVQITASLQDHTDGDFVAAHDRLQRGDIVGVTGVPGKTKTVNYPSFHKPFSFFRPTYTCYPKHLLVVSPIKSNVIMDLFMRIAPELYLKELVVGGLDRVYEIGRVFRNEGIDMTHNPEFSICEFYMAYADMYDLMDITESMISGLVKAVTGGYKIKYHPDGKDVEGGREYEIDFSTPWKRFDMMKELEAKLGAKLPLQISYIPKRHVKYYLI
ncbi:hypothetical protein IEQ34_025147 [Dendrobium chrysotoxum]|uniref:lysine--tRNA ligase n=1 Tax=Dendrobium chrysotoxum TaxID=161865 RepID=A0AAV7FQN5_DENCH|nr:hypothetical protein IEQ34_025147 [Dendrobium chrysotoxum]